MLIDSSFPLAGNCPPCWQLPLLPIISLKARYQKPWKWSAHLCRLLKTDTKTNLNRHLSIGLANIKSHLQVTASSTYMVIQNLYWQNESTNQAADGAVCGQWPESYQQISSQLQNVIVSESTWKDSKRACSPGVMPTSQPSRAGQ